MTGKCLIGTSGWSYVHWRGPFYPEGLKASDELSFYMERFETVEINNTFYHLPSEDAFRSWHKTAPPGFIYALKGSRFITHMKKLKDPEGPLSLFIERARLLKDSLGPVLFQLPPRWRKNTERLKGFVDKLPRDLRFAFEFRDSSWFDEDVYEVLKGGGAALCVYHMPGFQSPVLSTAPFVYIRFHGTDFLYGGSYPKAELKRWAGVIKGFLKEGKDVYAYFNNDEAAYAVKNALELREMVG